MGSSTTVVSRRRTQAPKPARASRNKSKSMVIVDGDEFSDDTLCDKCGSGDYPAQLLLCDKCDRGFHLFCLRPILASVPKGSWLCPSCDDNKNITKFPLVQTKIVDFFRIQRPSSSFNKLSPGKDCQKKRKRNSSLIMSKKKRKLLPFNPTKDPTRRMEQMASLATALLAAGADFSNDLTYMPGMAPKQLTEQHLSERECRFTVEADAFIRDWTLITEYVGDVDYLKNREADDGDSMMTLLSTNDPSKGLVICPDKRSNIARFINGINNHAPDGKKKQNVKCVRFDVNGEGRVLLIASRDIRKGERLYYDYNGYENEYPTEHFV
ncbi:unnamed protein product [Withania somnifera]